MSNNMVAVTPTRVPTAYLLFEQNEKPRDPPAHRGFKDNAAVLGAREAEVEECQGIGPGL